MVIVARIGVISGAFVGSCRSQLVTAVTSLQPEYFLFSFTISCSAELLMTNSLSFCLSKHVFILPSCWKMVSQGIEFCICGLVLFLYFERSLQMLNHFFFCLHHVWWEISFDFIIIPLQTSCLFFFLSGCFQGAFPLSLGCSSVTMMYAALVFFWMFALLCIYWVSVVYELLFWPNLWNVQLYCFRCILCIYLTLGILSYFSFWDFFFPYYFKLSI